MKDEKEEFLDAKQELDKAQDVIDTHMTNLDDVA